MARCAFPSLIAVAPTSVTTDGEMNVAPSACVDVFLLNWNTRDPPPPSPENICCSAAALCVVLIIAPTVNFGVDATVQSGTSTRPPSDVCEYVLPEKSPAPRVPLALYVPCRALPLESVAVTAAPAVSSIFHQPHKDGSAATRLFHVAVASALAPPATMPGIMPAPFAR